MWEFLIEIFLKKKDNFNVLIFDFNFEKLILILKYLNLKLVFFF